MLINGLRHDLAPIFELIRASLGMPLPEPVPALVIRYAYLWQAEQQGGQSEGVKERPCAVILVTTGAADEQWVTEMDPVFWTGR